MSLTETRAAPLHLWREAEILLRQIFALYGEPQQIAFQHTLTAKAHQVLAQWLRAAEALLRQLLLIEAAALTPQRPAPHRPKCAIIRQKRFIEHHADHPEHWRVSFRIFMDRRRPRRPAPPARRRRSISAARFTSAWPLAERAEALLRVLNNPAPYACRLARKLFARPERADTIVDALSNPNAHRGIIAAEVLTEFWSHCAEKLRAFRDSS